MLLTLLSVDPPYTLYRGTKTPNTAEIDFHTSPDGKLWTVYTLGHTIEPPFLLPHQLPHCTIVKFREALPLASLPRRHRQGPVAIVTPALAPVPPPSSLTTPSSFTSTGFTTISSPSFQQNSHASVVRRRRHQSHGRYSLFGGVTKFFGHDAGLEAISKQRKRTSSDDQEEDLRAAKRVCKALVLGGMGYLVATSFVRAVA